MEMEMEADGLRYETENENGNVEAPIGRHRERTNYEDKKS